jgi:hypothetical protein
MKLILDPNSKTDKTPRDKVFLLALLNHVCLANSKEPNTGFSNLGFSVKQPSLKTSDTGGHGGPMFSRIIHA